MALIFPRWTNKIPPIVAVGGGLVTAAVVGAFWYWGSPKYTDVGYAPVQPVPFSHRLHAGDLGLDCRYCHNTVERGAKAAVPPTETCMNCHRTILKDSPKLKLVRESWKKDMPIPWVRVHMLPDYAYFDHSVHLKAGVGCASCHGRVDQMDVVTQRAPLSMSWCLTCHRDPRPNLRPLDKVTDMTWDTASASYDPDKDPARTYKLRPPIHCSGCHR